MTARSQTLSATDEGAARRAIADFQSDTAELIGAPVPFIARATLHTITVMIAVLIILAAVVPVDRVVKARGRIVSEAPTMLVQPLDIAIIRQINVRAGEIVKKGTLLAALDPTFSTADYTRLMQQRASLTQEVARLQAEFDGSLYMPPADDPWARVQTALYEARKAEYSAALARFDEKIAATEQTIARMRHDLTYFTERLALYAEVEGMRSALEKKQVGSKLSKLVASDSRIEMERNVSTTSGNILATGHELEALRAERIMYERGRSAEVARALADRRGALEQIREETAKADKRRQLVELRAVEDAVVLQVGQFSVGSVVQPAEKLFTLVPIETKLEVDAEIEARDQGSVQVGDAVELKLDAWPFVEHGAVKGTVRSISADSFTPKDGAGKAYYIAKVEITKAELRKVPKDFRMIPGMPLTADIAVGTHTMLAYMLDGALKTVDEGMTEP